MSEHVPPRTRQKRQRDEQEANYFDMLPNELLQLCFSLCSIGSRRGTNSWYRLMFRLVCRRWNDVMGVTVRDLSLNSSLEGFYALRVAVIFPYVRRLSLGRASMVASPLLELYTLTDLSVMCEDARIYELVRLNQNQLESLTMGDEGFDIGSLPEVEKLIKAQLPTLKSLQFNLHDMDDCHYFTHRLTKILSRANLSRLGFDLEGIFSNAQMFKIINGNKNLTVLEISLQSEEPLNYVPEITAPIQELIISNLYLFGLGLPELPQLHTLETYVDRVSLEDCLWAPTVRNLRLTIFNRDGYAGIIPILQDFVALENLFLHFHCFMPDMVEDDQFIDEYLDLTAGIKVTTRFWRGNVEAVFRKALDAGGKAAELYRKLFPTAIGRFEAAIEQGMLVRDYYELNFPDDLMQITAMPVDRFPF